MTVLRAKYVLFIQRTVRTIKAHAYSSRSRQSMLVHVFNFNQGTGKAVSLKFPGLIVHPGMVTDQ